MTDSADVPTRLQSLLPAAKLLAVYHLTNPDPKGTVLAGSEARLRFGDRPDYHQDFYTEVYHSVLIPLSSIPLASILSLDLPSLLLPDPSAPDYQEQCSGLITTLDQTRAFTGGTYNARYTRCFFDPICTLLAKQLFFSPSITDDQKPDRKEAWLSRGYTFEQWLTRVFMLWAPLVHSDTFMVRDRQKVKDFIHSTRAEIEGHYGVTDPFAPLEESDDIDLTLFPRMIADGPPEKSLSDPDTELRIWEYGFWFLRIMNAHFALTDYCGHYPYATEWHGRELTERDREYLEKTGGALYDEKAKPVFEDVKRDVREGRWKAMAPIGKFEEGR